MQLIASKDDMKLKKLENAEKYTGLYIVDFGEHTSTGFTGDEVEMLLESEKYQDVKIYKIHKAYPDGTLELCGMPNEIFNLESGMFFFSKSRFEAQRDYKALLDLAVSSPFPARAKLHLSCLQGEKYVVALIYPAECEDEISAWLLDKDFQTQGEVLGGVSEVQKYYDADPQVLERHQLISFRQSKSALELFSALKNAVQR